MELQKLFFWTFILLRICRTIFWNGWNSGRFSRSRQKCIKIYQGREFDLVTFFLFFLRRKFYKKIKVKKRGGTFFHVIFRKTCVLCVKWLLSIGPYTDFHIETLIDDNTMTAVRTYCNRWFKATIINQILHSREKFNNPGCFLTFEELIQKILQKNLNELPPFGKPWWKLDFFSPKKKKL